MKKINPGHRLFVPVVLAVWSIVPVTIGVLYLVFG